MKLLLAVDGSAGSLAAVRHALSLVEAGLQASFLLAAVDPPTFLFEQALPPGSGLLERSADAPALKALQEAEALLRGARVPFEREVGSGDPAPAIVEMSERHGCSGIVMGARGLNVVRSALLGSVSQGVLHAARVPVTIVKA